MRWSVCAVVAGVCVCGCGPKTDSGATKPPLYWDVRSLGAGFAPMGSAELPSVPPKILADGSVIAVNAAGVLQRHDVLTGAWKSFSFPVVTDGGLPISGHFTWYQDDQNYGGDSVGNGHSLNGGWAVVNGAVHECEGDACTPVYLRADGTFVTRQWNSLYFMTWRPGENPAAAYPLIDDLDIHNYKLDMIMPCFAVKQVGADGTIFLAGQTNGLLACANAIDGTPPALVKDFRRLDIGKTQFNLGVEDPSGCCNVWGINDDGKVLGVREGKPVIRAGATIEPISDELGEPFVFNKRGDVLYRPRGSARVRARLANTLYEFPDCEVTKQLDGETADILTTNAIDMSESGQVLFWQKQAGTASVSLLLGTPRTQQLPAGVVGHLSFAAKSGSGPTPGALERPWRVTGSVASGSFALAAAFPTADPCVDTKFIAFATSATGGWGEGALISAVTGMNGATVASASFANDGGVYLAVSGGFRISAVSPAGFTATPEGLVFKKQGSQDTFEAAGEFRAAP